MWPRFNATGTGSHMTGTGSDVTGSDPKPEVM